MLGPTLLEAAPQAEGAFPPDYAGSKSEVETHVMAGLREPRDFVRSTPAPLLINP